MRQRKHKGDAASKEDPETSSDAKRDVSSKEKANQKDSKTADAATSAKGAQSASSKDARAPPAKAASAGRATYCLAMLLLAVSFLLCAAALMEAQPAAAAAVLHNTGITAVLLKQSFGIELPGMLGAHLAHHGAQVGGGPDDMVWFNEERTDGMTKAAYDKYSNLWEDAVAYHQEERLQEAIDTYSAALAVRPGDANSLANLGSIYNELDEHEKALDAYRQAIATHPDHFVSHLNLAGTLDRQGSAKLAATAEALKAALAIRPDDANALEFMKSVQERMAEADKTSAESVATDAAAGADAERADGAAQATSSTSPDAKEAGAGAAPGVPAGAAAAAAAAEDETVELLGEGETDEAADEDEGGFEDGTGGIPLPLD